MKSKDQEWAVFWCSLLRPVLFGEIDPSEVHRYLQQLSEQEYRLPNGIVKRPSLSTLKRKLKAYQTRGFDSLARKKRHDKGKPRSVSPEIIEKAVELKKELANRSAHKLNFMLEAMNGTTVARSTLYRHLKHHGATRLKLGLVKEKVRCRWTRDKANELWLGDFSQGPYVLVGEEVCLSHLSLFIDCHSRYVVEGRYYLKENLDILIDSLIRAWSVHGLPEELYLDNAKIYHSKALRAVCYALHIKRIHRKAGDPSPGGLIERLFGTNQSQFETEVRAGNILSLEYLNRAFQAWLHVDYHKSVHSETKRTPLELYQSAIKRSVDMDYALKFFMKKEARIVHPDFSDVSINNSFFSVNPKFRGDKVLVRYDPFSSMDKVFVYSLDDEFLGTATRYNREKREQPEPAPRQGKPQHSYLDLIVEKHNQQINAQTKGIDFYSLSKNQRWPFASFLQKLAGLMGRKGGASAFSAEELETLKKLYDRYPQLNLPMLTQAFEKAEQKNIPHLVLQLQLLNNNT